MRMTDGNCSPLLWRVAQRKRKLLANGCRIGRIIEKRNVAVGGGYPHLARGVVSHGGGGRAAIHEEEVVLVEYRHEGGHEMEIGGGFGALVVVGADGVG